jgi:hypothetical protein
VWLYLIRYRNIAEGRERESERWKHSVTTTGGNIQGFDRGKQRDKRGTASSHRYPVKDIRLQR